MVFTRRVTFCAALLALAATGGLAQVAAPPPVINFQGRLTSAAGTPVPDGSYAVTVSLWDAASGGSQKWSQTLNSVAVKNGAFSALLTVDTAGLFDGGSLWLQTQVGEDPPMTPRQRVASVPFALRAGTVPDASITASKLAANALGGAWQTGGNAGLGAAAFLGTTDGSALAFRTNNVERMRLDVNGNLGIGTNPVAPLTFKPSLGEKIDFYPFPGATGTYGIGVQDALLQLHTDYNGADIAFGYGRSTDFHETARITGGGNLLLRDKAVISLGSNVAGKQVDAGKIGYEVFSPDALDIVGAGTTSLNRKVQVYAEGGTNFTGEITAPVVNILGGSDVAEPYDVAPANGVAAKPGMVVCIDPGHVGRMKVASAAYSPMVAGIVSGANGIAPGITLRQKGTVADGALPVATMGRVWALCDADANGPIHPGDMLTSSATPGHAMRATDPDRRDGAVIGKAMSSLESGKGLVLVLVSLK